MTFLPPDLTEADAQSWARFFAPHDVEPPVLATLTCQACDVKWSRDAGTACWCCGVDLHA